MTGTPERPLKIFQWCASMEDGTFRYRLEMPANELRRLGHEVRASQQMDQWARDEADVIVGQRVCQPGAVLLWIQVCQELRARGAVSVYEVDDDLFSIHPRANPLGLPFADPRVRTAMKAAIRAAAMVTVSTEPLADVMRKIRQGADAATVVVLPNSITADTLNVQRTRPPARATMYGWQGSPTHERDWLEARDAVVTVLSEDWRTTRLRFVGHYYLDGLFRNGRPISKIDHQAWTTNLAEHHRRVADFDVSLAPLERTPFNRSKCLDAATRIGTKRGVIPIGEVVPGDKVWREGWRKVEAVERTPARPGLKLTLSNGQELKLTGEHRMMVNGEWTRADEVIIGATLTAEQNFTGASEQTWPWPANVRGGRKVAFEEWSYLTAVDSPRIAITPRWGRILGAFAGDGSCAATSICISCDGQDQDWIDSLIEDFRALGLTPSTQRVTTFGGEVLRRRSVHAASASLQRVMESLGVIEQREYRTPKRIPCVPEIIWRSPLPVIAEFLAGYFEADGTTTHTGVSAVSKTEQLIRDVQQLLLLFGIESTVSPLRGKAQNGFVGNYWIIRLRRAAADVFAKEVGFRSVRKRARLKVITSKPHSNAYRPMSWAPTVTGIEACLVNPVDIQVEGEAFIASGLLSHNSALRVIESLALGVPVIASDVPAYQGWVEDGVTGFYARSTAQWVAAMRKLQDAGLRAEMGAAGRRAAAAWTIEANAPKWINAYRSLL